MDQVELAHAWCVIFLDEISPVDSPSFEIDIVAFTWPVRASTCSTAYLDPVLYFAFLHPWEVF